MSEPSLGTEPSTGRLFVISAPSGAGKTTLCGHLMERFPQLAYSISHTTRPPRPGETDGVDYWFISQDDFESGIRSNRWVEYARVHEAYYGTSAETLADALGKGCDLLLDIDVQGARQIRRRFPDAVTIFILPPSMDELARRLRNRQSDSPDAIARRLVNAEEEMAAADEYDHVVVNDRLADAIDTLGAMVASAMGVAPPEDV